MTQYIDKSALVAEVERLAKVQPINEFQPKEQNKIDWLSGKMFAINLLRVFLDTLEVKEVDLEKEIQSWVEDNSVNGYYREDVYETAEHFFELGLKAAQKGEEA